MPQPRKLTAKIIFNLTPGERAALTLMANREGLTMTDFLRQAIRREAEKRGLVELGLFELREAIGKDKNHEEG